jgi:hypothetical protein
MPTNSLLPSVLGNVTAARDRVSAVRQRLGLEMGSQQMRPVHPSPEAPADKPGAAIKTAASTPKPPKAEKPSDRLPPTPEDDDWDWENAPLAPDKEVRMLAKLQDFIDKNNNGIDDRVEAAAQAPKDGASPTPKDSAGRQKLKDPLISKALAPFKEFYMQTGRMPTIDDLRKMARGTTDA